MCIYIYYYYLKGRSQQLRWRCFSSKVFCGITVNGATFPPSLSLIQCVIKRPCYLISTRQEIMFGLLIFGCGERGWLSFWKPFSHPKPSLIRWFCVEWQRADSGMKIDQERLCLSPSLMSYRSETLLFAYPNTIASIAHLISICSTFLVGHFQHVCRNWQFCYFLAILLTNCAAKPFAIVIDTFRRNYKSISWAKRRLIFKFTCKNSHNCASWDGFVRGDSVIWMFLSCLSLCICVLFLFGKNRWWRDNEDGNRCINRNKADRWRHWCNSDATHTSWTPEASDITNRELGLETWRFISGWR